MVINPAHAQKLWDDLLIHDDGICGVGGKFADLIGAFGHGKSTLLMQAAQFVRYLPYGVTKIDIRKNRDSFTDIKTFPETVFLRGMSDDHWNALLPKSWARSYPKYGKSKPVVVHISEDDNYSFVEVAQGKKHTINHDLNIKKYSSAEDLLDHVKIGAINVIYEPSHYILSSEMRVRLAQQKLQEKKDIKKGDILAPPPMWWFELSDALLSQTGGQHVTIILDELHSVTPAYPAGDLFHVIGNFAKSLIHFRKNNISLLGSTHDENLLDYRVKERLPIKVWFPGSDPKNSMVQLKLLRSLDDIGEAIIEETNIEFGVLEFDKIHHQPPILKAQLKE